MASGSLDVESTQQVSSNVTSVTHFNVSDDVGGQTTILTASTGNTAEEDSIQGGPITGNISQTVGAYSITSENDFNAGAASMGAVSAVSQAVANSVAMTVVDATSAVTINQSSAASVDAESGSEVTGSATLMYTPGTASFVSSAVGNNITGTGFPIDSGASQSIVATQRDRPAHPGRRIRLRRQRPEPFWARRPPPRTTSRSPTSTARPTSAPTSRITATFSRTQQYVMAALLWPRLARLVLLGRERPWDTG